MPPRSTKKNPVSETLRQASEPSKKDHESLIPVINQTSKQISKSKIPAPSLKKKTSLESSCRKVPPDLVTPINLKFGKKSSVTVKSETQTAARQNKPKNIPVVIDIDLDSDEEAEKPKTASASISSGAEVPSSKVISSRKVLKEPEKVGNNQKVPIQNKSGIQRDNVDWKSKYEAMEKKYLEKVEERKQLDTKIPNMIEEFQKCEENL